MFVVFRCRKCGRYLYTKEGVKTKKCVCGYTNSMKKTAIKAKVKEERDASELVRKLQGSGTSFRSLEGADRSSEMLW
jgi:ribosomal protein L37E